jgi:hypothetical protein
MESQERAGKLMDRHQLKQAAGAATADLVRDLVSQLGGTTISLLRTRLDLWPPIETAESEVITAIVAARELEQAAHAIQAGYSRQARETGCTWYEIGQALDLLWYAIVSNESIGDEAYDYALRYDPGATRKPYTWTCQTCQQVITDHGPWRQLPAQEERHALDCRRWTHRLAAWRRHNPEEA